MSAMMLTNGEESTDASGRNRERIVMGWNVTLVEDAENDGDGGESGEDRRPADLKSRNVPGRFPEKDRVDGGGNFERQSERLRVDGGAEGSSRRKIEGERDRRENSLVIDGQGGIRRFEMSEGAEGDEFAGIGGNVDVESASGVRGRGSDFHDDVILIEAFVDVGDLTLAEGVAESIVDVLNGNAQTRRRVAVNEQMSSRARAIAGRY